MSGGERSCLCMTYLVSFILWTVLSRQLFRKEVFSYSLFGYNRNFCFPQLTWSAGSWPYTKEEPTNSKAINVRSWTRHRRTDRRTDEWTDERTEDLIAVISFARLWTAFAKQQSVLFLSDCVRQDQCEYDYCSSDFNTLWQKCTLPKNAIADYRDWKWHNQDLLKL